MVMVLTHTYITATIYMYHYLLGGSFDTEPSHEDLPTIVKWCKPSCKAQWKGEEDKAATEEEVGRQHQGMDRPGVLQDPEGSREQRKMEETGCEITCGTPMTLMVQG